VEGSIDFPVAFENLLMWLEREKCMDLNKACFITCGDWDLLRMLPAQYELTYRQKQGRDSPIFKNYY
jgi:hypothetical protein